MIVSHLHIQGVRNIEQASLSFGSGFNFIYGPNGAGKTSVLEALAILGRGRSFRTSSLNRVISHEAKDLVVRAVLGDQHEQQVGFRRARTGGPEISIDGRRSNRLSDVARLVPLQVMLPDVSQLVFGPPRQRREFLDWGLFHVEQRYLPSFAGYRRALNQRNAWLKQLHGKLPPGGASTDPWLPQMVSSGVELTMMRAEYVAQLDIEFRHLLKQLAPELMVELSVSGGVYSADELFKNMSETFERDVKFGVSHVGPHRADLRFRSGDRAAVDAVSRGQAKLIASAAVFAKAVLHEKRTADRCVFLIDDFGAELDVAHWRLFVQTLSGLRCQVIATAAQAPLLDQGMIDHARCEMFHVEQGAVRRVTQ